MMHSALEPALVLLSASVLGVVRSRMLHLPPAQSNAAAPGLVAWLACSRDGMCNDE